MGRSARVQMGGHKACPCSEVVGEVGAAWDLAVPAAICIFNVSTRMQVEPTFGL